MEYPLNSSFGESKEKLTEQVATLSNLKKRRFFSKSDDDFIRNMNEKVKEQESKQETDAETLTDFHGDSRLKNKNKTTENKQPAEAVQIHENNSTILSKQPFEDTKILKKYPNASPVVDVKVEDSQSVDFSEEKLEASNSIQTPARTLDVTQTFFNANNPVFGFDKNVQMSPKAMQMETPSNSSSKKTHNYVKKTTKEDPVFDLAGPVAVEDSPMLATVYVAAPHLQNHCLAVIGSDKLLGAWEQPQGNFEPLLQISEDIYIFQGVIPVPSFSGSPFKFVHFNTVYKKLLYEGEGPTDNRTDELLPGSTNFFTFKLKSKTIFGRIMGGWSNFFPKSETKHKIAVEFFNIMFDHIIRNIMPNWDGAYEFIGDSLEQIQRASGNCSTNGFLEFLNQRFQKSEQLDFDRLLLLVVAASKMGMYSESMKEVLQKNSKAFSLYLVSFKSLKRNCPGFVTVLENLAQHAGPDFWWILFRINRHEEKFKKFGHVKVSESTLETLREIPELLLNNEAIAARVVDYLIRWNDIDKLYCNLRPIFAVNANYQQLLDQLFLQKLLIHKTNSSDFAQILHSDFLKKAYSLSKTWTDSNQSPSSNGGLFGDCIRMIFNQKLPEVVKLAIEAPDYLLPVVIPVVEDVAVKINPNISFSREDYRFFSQLDAHQLDDFPQTKKKIEGKLMKMTKELLQSGSFHSIPSLRLFLLVLAERMDVPLLDRSEVVDLQKSIKSLPPKFFQNLHSFIQLPGVSLDKTLRAYRKGKTKEIVERLENHFDQLDEILEKVLSRHIPLIELKNLNDPQVLDCLKNIGLTDDLQAELRRDVEELRKRHQLYVTVYGRFARFGLPIQRQMELDLELEEDEDNERDISDTIQILDPREWEGYLTDIDFERSMMTLENALTLPLPLELKAADWLLKIKDCTLFINKVWHPQLKSWQTFPLFKDDLASFIEECADGWERLAVRVAGGDASLQEMDEIIRLEPDPSVLSRRHLKCKPVDQVRTAYRNFQSIQDLRYLICPFVAALRFFIKDKDPIDRLYNFVENNLIKHWETTQLSRVLETGIVQMLNAELNIDPERPETKDAMHFIISLVTDGNRSPLIEWLREKTVQDMEAMGKILQGTLLEAYGQLQTLKTRIAPFLHQEFNTFQDLLRAVRLSEERFAQRISGQVQPIKCKWLASMLPEIQAAMRASVISPSEDAKEKLAKLRQVVIDPQGDTFSMLVHLEPTGSLSMDELKQAFQLLDMAVMEDGRDGDAGDLVGRTRKHVGLIEQLSKVFGLVFASGCITYTFRERIVIELNDLEEEIERLHEQLDNWNSKWKEMDEMRLLSLFSRGYLLQLADLIGRNKTEEAFCIFKFLLPSSPSKLEPLLERLAQNTPRISDDDDCWLSTAQLFNILRQLNQVLQVVFDQQCPEVVLPPFLTSYGRTLMSHFIAELSSS